MTTIEAILRTCEQRVRPVMDPCGVHILLVHFLRRMLLDATHAQRLHSQPGDSAAARAWLQDPTEAARDGLTLAEVCTVLFPDSPEAAAARLHTVAEDPETLLMVAARLSACWEQRGPYYTKEAE